MASKSKRRRRVLGASCILAALIIAGSSFAWFTSKDEVVNRLSASSDYGVAIAEDFAPPENWVPGQTINKDVSIVNTGNVDAFVRTWLEGEMKVVARDTVGFATNTVNASTTKLADTNAGAIKDARLVPTSANATTYVRELNKTDYTQLSGADAKSEVKSLQAGGWLAYAPAKCEWQYTETKADADPANINANTTVTAVADGTAPAAATASTTEVANGTYGCAVNSDTFLPKTTGLYLFRRNLDANTLDADKNVYYSGYYYVAPSSGAGYGNGTYYALNTMVTGTNSDNETVYAALVGNDGSTLKTHSDSTGVTIAGTTDRLLTADVDNVLLFKAESSVIDNSGLTWTYDDTNKKFQVAPTSGATGLKINVELVGGNVLASADAVATNKWKPIGSGAGTTFYYTNDLEEGSTSAQLVDKVQLDQSVTANDYVAFDFDLNVKMDSIQVTMDSAGKETYEPVVSTWAAASGDAATGAKVTAATWTGNEITTLTWGTT